jgi:hypothetical protein
MTESELTASDPSTIAPRQPHIQRAVSWLKRKHWLFRLGDFVRVRLQQQDRMVRHLAEMARQNYALASEVQELKRRLEHHEVGPLAGSKRDLDRARGDGVSRIVRV